MHNAWRMLEVHSCLRDKGIARKHSGLVQARCKSSATAWFNGIRSLCTTLHVSARPPAQYGLQAQDHNCQQQHSNNRSKRCDGGR